MVSKKYNAATGALDKPQTWEELKARLMQPLTENNLPKRLYTALVEIDGLSCFAEIYLKSEMELRRIPNLGDGSFEKLKEILYDQGLPELDLWLPRVSYGKISDYLEMNKAHFCRASGITSENGSDLEPVINGLILMIPDDIKEGVPEDMLRRVLSDPKTLSEVSSILQEKIDRIKYEISWKEQGIEFTSEFDPN